MKPFVFPRGSKQVLFPFGRDQQPQMPFDRGRGITLSRSAHRPFLPLGLFVWGATPDTYVSAIVVGAQHEASLPLDPIPARYFSEGRSLGELQALADAGELVLSVEQRRVIEMEVAERGMSVSVRMTGSFDDVCLWGLTYSQHQPLLSQRIVPAKYDRECEGGEFKDVEGFHGQVIEHHLSGDRVISNVYAPSEESVCRLLVAARHPERMY